MRLVVLGGGESGVGTAILGKKKGYDYIYGTGDAATVLYAKEGYDITKEVLKELNDTYKATKKDDKVATKEEEKK